MTKTHMAVFDAATQNACFEFPPTINIPAEKSAARAELAAAMAKTGVTIKLCAPQHANVITGDNAEEPDHGESTTPKAANDNIPPMAIKGEWVGDEFFPDTPQAWLDKDVVAEKKAQQTATIRRITTRIAKRQSIGDGWNGRAANDNNEPLPIITALSRDGRDDQISIIRRYRFLADVVGGSSYGDTVLAGTGDGIEVAGRTGFPVQDRLLAASQAKDWKSLPDGEMIQHETRQTTKQKLSTGTRAKPANDNTSGAAVPLSLGYGEDAIIARMDGEPILRELRIALGPLQAVFEDAVLEGATFTAIGEARGYSGKQASAAGRALVYAGLDTVVQTWRVISVGMKADAKAAQTAVQQRRAELAAKRAIDLGLSA